MIRSRAIARLREERKDAELRLNASRDSWHGARRDLARSLERDLRSERQDREDHRIAALDRLREQLDGFATAQGKSRLAQDSERAAFMTGLINAVNEMIAGFETMGAARREEAITLSNRVQAFLATCRSARSESCAEHAAYHRAFRAKLSEDSYRACTDDFR